MGSQNRKSTQFPQSKQSNRNKSQKMATSTQKTAPNNSNPRDLDRDRAACAWKCIQEITSKNIQEQKKYGTIARKLPTLIQVNGLAQTLAFLKAKGEAHHIAAFKHLSGWVCGHFHWQDTDLLGKILSPNMDSLHYRLATAESLSFLQWLKRFAEAELDTEEG